MKIRKGAFVEYSDTVTDQNNVIVEQASRPVNYIHGHRAGMHVKIERAMAGFCRGDEVVVSLAASEGYGTKDPSLIITEDLDSVPENMRQLGAEADFKNAQGESKTFRVTDISDGKVTLDANHPLADQSITFTLKILKVRAASEAELSANTTLEQDAGTPASKPSRLN